MQNVIVEKAGQENVGDLLQNMFQTVETRMVASDSGLEGFTNSGIGGWGEDYPRRYKQN